MDKYIKAFKSSYMVVLALIFSLFLGVDSAKAEEIDFSDYSTTYGYEQLAQFEDGDDRQALYTIMYQEYEALWDSNTDYGTEVIEGTGHYVLGNIPIDNYEYEASDVMEVYLALQFDNPIFYYMPSVFYTSNYMEEGKENKVAFVQLAIDGDYNEATERAVLNTEVLSDVAEYANVVSSLDTDYEKITKVHDMILDSMYYSYDEDGNPSMDAWAHNVVGALSKGKGVCESYAKTFQLVMNYLGLESYIVTGVSHDENHAWNLVKMEDGYYYYVDCTWDDTSDTSSKEYFLKGTFEFEISHEKNLPTGEGDRYLYTLPEVQKDNYEKLIEMSYNGGTPVKYGMVAIAFEDMTDRNGSYVIDTSYAGSVYLPGGEWPEVKEIVIDGSGSDSSYVLGDVYLNCDVTIKETYIATESNHFIDILDIATFNLKDNMLTLENANTGGYSFIWDDKWGEYPDVSGPGVHIQGEAGSTLTLLDNAQMTVTGKNIQVDELIIDGAYVIVKDCNITADKLIFRDSKNLDRLPVLYLGSMLGAQSGMSVDISETIMDGIMGSVTLQGVYKGAQVSLGSVKGDNVFSIFIVCSDGEAYPQVSIDDSEVEVSYQLSNLISTTTDFDNYEHSIWDAIDYTGGYINIGDTDISKITSVNLTFYELDEDEELVESYHKNIVALCDKDSDNYLYRKYNENVWADSETVYGYVYYQECNGTTINIPKGIKYINFDAFRDCNSIENVYIPEGVYHIRDGAFLNCSIQEIKLPSTLYSLGEYSLGYNYDKQTGVYTPIDGFKIVSYGDNYVVKTYAENNGFDYEVIPIPDAVANLKTTSMTDSKVTLVWDASLGAQGYRIQREIDDSLIEVATIVGGSNTSYTISGLNTKDDYVFVVEPYIIDEAGNKVCVNFKSIIVRLVPKVTGLTYSARTTNSISLKWDKCEGVLGYRIEQYVDDDWMILGMIDGEDNTSYEVIDLIEGTNNKFRVCAYKYNHEYNFNYGIYTEKTVSTVLNPVKSFTYSGRTGDSITLKWDESLSAEGYVIEQYKSSKWVTVKTITNNETVSYKVTGLNPSTSYQFRIKTYKNSEGTKVYGAAKSLTVKTLDQIDLSKATVTIGQPSFGYTGNYIKPVVTVKVSVNGKMVTLTNWKDYKVTYSNFKNPGTATITVNGIGQYKGQKSIKFTIRPVDLSKGTATISQSSFGYTGAYIKPVVTVKAKVNGKTVTLTNWKDYKVTYSNFKNPGKATITVTGRGVYSGTLTLTFQIRPSQVKNIKYVGKSTTYVNFKWDKCVGVTGYEVYRATSKNGTYTKVGTVATTTAAFKNTGLKSKTTYYYKVRAYKTVGTTKIYGNYSSIYTIATK